MSSSFICSSKSDFHRYRYSHVFLPKLLHSSSLTKLLHSLLLSNTPLTSITPFPPNLSVYFYDISHTHCHDNAPSCTIVSLQNSVLRQHTSSSSRNVIFCF